MRQEVAVMKERLATLMGGGGAAGAAARGAAEAVDDAELAERARQAFLEVRGWDRRKQGRTAVVE